MQLPIFRVYADSFFSFAGCCADKGRFIGVGSFSLENAKHTAGYYRL